MPNNNVWDWFLEQEDATPKVDVMPDDNEFAQQQQPQQPQQQQQQPQQQPPTENDDDDDDDVTADPQDPDVPVQQQDKGFEEWRSEFMRLAIKGESNQMMASIQDIRDHDGLEAHQRKFVEDNIQILFYRQDPLLLPVTKEMRKLIRSDLDRTNPGTSVMQHLTTVLEQQGLLQQVLIKLTGLFGMKNDLHRKFLAAVMGAVQVGGGNTREDLVYNERDFTINFSTRFATQFGEVNLGAWLLREDDPDKYLTQPEMERLGQGSPEEKQVLRRRIICQSISERFLKRAFLIHVVGPDGTIYSIGWDLGSSLREAYQQGKIIVRGQKAETKEIMITDRGDIVPYLDIKLLYVRDSGETDASGRPQQVEVPFIERRNSALYLVADVETLQHAAATLAGLFFREMPYGGNPSDIRVLQRCVPDLVELLNKRCLGNTVPLPGNVAHMATERQPAPKVSPQR